MKTSTSALVCSFSQNRSSSASRALIDCEQFAARLLHPLAGRLVEAILLQQVEQREFLFAQALRGVARFCSSSRLFTSSTSRRNVSSIVVRSFSLL